MHQFICKKENNTARHAGHCMLNRWNALGCAGDPGFTGVRVMYTGRRPTQVPTGTSIKSTNLSTGITKRTKKKQKIVVVCGQNSRSAAMFKSKRSSST